MQIISLNTLVDVIRVHVPKARTLGELLLIDIDFVSFVSGARRNLVCTEIDKKLNSIIILMVKNCKNFQVLAGGRNGLPALSWTQKCECRLKYDTLMIAECLYMVYLFESGEANGLILVMQNRMLHHYTI